MLPLPGVALTWSRPTIIAGDTFVSTNVRRRVSGQIPFIRIAALSDPAVVAYTDYSAGSGVIYEYSVTYTVARSGSFVDSLDAPVVGHVAFGSVFLHEVQNPNYYAEVPSNALTLAPAQEHQLVQPWGREMPTAYFGEALSAKYTLQSVPQLLADQSAWGALRQLLDRQRTAGALLCLRSGTQADRAFVALTRAERRDKIGSYQQTVELDEVYYQEAV